MININFEITKDDYTFKDAIVLEDNHVLSSEQIEAMKQKRFDDWYALVTTPVEDDIDAEQPSEEE